MMVRIQKIVARASLVTMALWGVSFCGVLWYSEAKRHSEFEALAEAAQPLIEAIRQYQRDNGHPPRSLGVLVPEYIRVVPKTGHPQYADFEYAVDEGSSWVLRVPCSTGFGNWDEFFYWPTEDYPEHTGRGSIERIGRWAYLHE
jgi:hypothetical protein